jgi:hypothetical protein
VINVRNIEDARRALVALDQVVSSLSRWRQVNPAWFSVTAAGQLTCTSTHLAWDDGLPISWIQPGGVRYYGVIRDITEGVVSIAGPALDTAVALQALWIGRPEMVTQLQFFIAGVVGTASNEQLSTILGHKPVWGGPPAYLVDFSGALGTEAGTTNPFFNMVGWDGANWRLVSNANASAGIQPGIFDPVRNAIGTIIPAYYRLTYGQRIGVFCSTARVGGDPEDLSVSATLVME